MNKELLLGKDSSKLKQCENDVMLHPEVEQPLSDLKQEMQKHGFELTVLSSYRSFERQKIIWNEKACGKRALLDRDGNPLEYAELSKDEILHSILRWSALPGFSRHHWGTDFDVYCAKSKPENYMIQLIPSEVSDDGMFGNFHQKLDQLINQNKSFGFYRPYCKDLGGIAPERWHISYAPLADEFLNKISYEFFSQNISPDLELYDEIKNQDKIIFERYITNICPVPL